LAASRADNKQNINRKGEEIIMTKARIFSKLVAIMTILSILSFIFTGCGSKDTSSERSNSSDTTTTNVSKTDNASAQSTKSNTETKRYKIVVYKNGDGQGRQPVDQDPILKVLNETLNIDLDLNIIESEYESRLNLLAASGTLPDVMQVTQKQFESFSSQGLLLDLTPYVEKMPNFMETYPDYLTNKNLEIDGKHYFLNGVRPEKQQVKSYSSLWIRKDWLDNLGLDIPKTLDDIYKVAVAFTNNDPDRNGKNDTYGFAGMGGQLGGTYDPFQPFYGAYGTAMHGSYLLKDNKVVYSTTEEAFKDALGFIKKLIDSGSVDPDILVTKTFDQIREKAYKNTIGMMYFTWAEFVKPPYDEQLKTMTPDAEWIQIEPPEGPGGKWNGVYSQPGPVSKGYVLSAKLEEEPEKLDKVLEYLDYIVAGPGSNLVCYGIENVHYKVENGKIVALDAMSEVSYSWQHQIMGRNEVEYLATKFLSNESHITFAKDLPYLDRYNNFLKIPDGVNAGDKSAYESEEITKFIYGKRPLSEFDDFVKTLYDTYQLQLYIDSVEANLKEAGLIK